MGKFLKDDEPIGRFVAHTKRDYEIFEPVVFNSDVAGEIVAESGFVTDFASIPRILWRILPPWDTHRKAAIIHDWLYRTQPEGMTRKKADLVFHEAMKSLGVGSFKAWLMYRGVRTGGWATWNEHKKSKNEKANLTSAAAGDR